MQSLHTSRSKTLNENVKEAARMATPEHKSAEENNMSDAH